MLLMRRRAVAITVNSAFMLGLLSLLSRLKHTDASTCSGGSLIGPFFSWSHVPPILAARRCDIVSQLGASVASHSRQIVIAIHYAKLNG